MDCLSLRAIRLRSSSTYLTPSPSVVSRTAEALPQQPLLVNSGAATLQSLRPLLHNSNSVCFEECVDDSWIESSFGVVRGTRPRHCRGRADTWAGWTELEREVGGHKKSGTLGEPTVHDHESVFNSKSSRFTVSSSRFTVTVESASSSHL